MTDHRPVILGVAGSMSNCGKTTLACAIIARLAAYLRVGALKISTSTPDHRCERTGLACGCLRFDGSARTLRDECATAAKGKDTGRFALAGARPVHWLQATSLAVDMAATEAIQEFASLPVDVVVVEGAAPIRLGIADRSVLVYRADRPAKPTFGSLLTHGNVLAVSVPEPQDACALLDLRATLPWPGAEPLCPLITDDAASVDRVVDLILAPITNRLLSLAAS